MTKFFVDAQNNYIGGFDGVEPPNGAFEVPNPPDDARQKWNGNGWVALNPSLNTAADLAKLNAALVEPGSVVRALGLVMFAEINKLRVLNGDPAYTLSQFITALQAQMRS